MKNYFLLFILSIFIVKSYSQQKPPMIDLNEDISLSGLVDSIRSNYGDQRSTRLLKNLNAKIEDYLIINHDGDTIIVDTSLTINKFHKINYLRKDNFELIPFSNTGHTYNDLSYSVDKVKLFPSFGSRTKHYSYMEIEDVNYYDVPTPFTELMYRSVFEQGHLLDALYSVNTSRQFNFTISRKGLRSLGNYQHFLSSSSNFRFSTNYNSEATVDDESCEYSLANVIGQETGISYSQGSESASMSYRLSNTGGITAYNVQYRLRIQYKCMTGFAGQGWTYEFLPNSSSLYTYGDIPAGQYVDFTDNVGLCSGLGIEQFTFEVYQVIWD